MKKKTKKPIFDSRAPGGRLIVYGAVLVTLINVISSVPLYTYLLLLLICYVIVKKQWKKAVALVPFIMVVLIAVAAPVILGHPRYVFPMIYAMPVIVSYCAWTREEVSGEASLCSDTPVSEGAAQG